MEDPSGLAGTVLEMRFAIDHVVARGGFGIARAPEARRGKAAGGGGYFSREFNPLPE